MQWIVGVQGEEVQSVSSKGKEAEGVSGLPEPEEAAAEAAEDGEVPPAAPTPAAPKDPFPLKDSIIIDLQALPQVCGSVADNALPWLMRPWLLACLFWFAI